MAVILALEMIGPASVHAFAEASDGQETVSAEETAVYDEDPTAAGETFPGEEPPAGEVTETEEAEDGEAEEETEAPEGAAEESESAPPAEDEPAAQETDAAETAETAPAEDTEETASEDDVQLVVREENTFTISDGVLTGFSGGGVVRIPETVTRITNDAFYGNSDITEVIIPDTVTSIEDQSFRFCENLESINIPYGITEIGPGMFECCCSLKEIEIPDTVAWIGEYAFEHCSSLQEVDLPASVTQIDTNTFLNCVNLRTVVIRSADASVRGTVFEPSTVIVAPAGSAAQSYAETHGLRFAALGEEAVLTLASAGDGALSVTRNGAALSDGAAIAVGDRLIVRSTTSRGGQYLTANGLDLIFGYTQKAWYYELAFDPMNDPAAGIVLTVNGDMRIEAVYRDPVPLQNALNADGSALDIQTGGDVPLLPAFEQGRDLAAVTALESGQKSYAQIRVTGPGFICYEVQLEESGSFRPLLDGQIAGSGVIKDHAWRQGTIEIPSGIHTVRLELSGPGGGRLDEIFFTDDENSLAIGQITVTDQLDLNIGETQAIAWTTVPAEIGDRTPSWTSDDPSVAEVDAEGHVTAVGRGNTLIHAALDTVSAVCHVYVSSSSVRGDFVYEGNTLTGYTGSDASVVIPDGTEAIAANAFRGHTEITDVTIPSGVTSIGAYAFRGCTSLELVSVPDSVTDIGRFAFPLLESVIVFCQKDSAAYDHAIEYGLRYCLVNDEIQGGDLTLDVYQVMQEAEAVTGQNISGMQEIPVDADEHYTYYLSGGDLYRQEISRDLFDAEPVFSLGSRPAAAKVFGSVIYFALPNTSAGTTRIVGYDTEHSTQVMDQVFPVVIRSAGQFALDADQNLYAVQNSLDTYSFDRNGNKTSENIRSGGFFITGLEQIMLDQVSADGRVLFARYYSAYRALKSTDSDSSFPSLYATRYYEGFMEIRNGRFINDDLMVKNASRAVNAGWVFLENREYAVNRYGEIAEFEWGFSHEGSFDYHVLFRLGRGGDTGTVAADMIGSEIFFATHDGTVTVFDTQQKKVTAHYRLGTEAGVQGLYAVNGVMYVRYTQNGTPMMAPLSAFVREEAHPEIRTDHVS
ncbi:MAG: leucine-rich repeat protein, partial [Lachnospiraceae bacterium]|nr:leucine-rich repeat protein [Lachnospiraceae bacterium]